MYMSDDLVHEDNVSEQLRHAEKERQREVAKPYIDHLEDAVGVDPLTGKRFLKVDVGSKIVIERNIPDVNNEPRWFDTKVYVVRKIDNETGNMNLYEPEVQNFAKSNINALDRGYRIKIHAKNTKLQKKQKVIKKLERQANKERVAKEKGPRTWLVYKGPMVRVKNVPYGPGPDVVSQLKSGDRVAVEKTKTGINVTLSGANTTEQWTKIDE